MSDHGSCSDCFFYEPLGSGGLVERKVPTGRCRRHAPSPTFVSGVHTVRRDPDHWPIVRPDDWCGEFRPKQG